MYGTALRDSLQGRRMPENIVDTFRGSRIGTTEVPPRSYQYLQYCLRSRSILAVPSTPESALRYGLATLPAGTWRKRLLRQLLRFGTTISRRTLARRVQSPIDYDDGKVFSSLLDTIRRTLNSSCWFPVVTYPSSPARRRFYIHILGQNGRSLAYVKAVHRTSARSYRTECAIHGRLSCLNLPFCIAPSIATGCIDSYSYEIFAPLPAASSYIRDRWQDRPAAISAAIANIDSREEVLKNLSWWPAFVSNREKYRPLYDYLAPFGSQTFKTTFSHGDFHRFNMLLDASNRLWVFDWEDAADDAPFLTCRIRWHLAEAIHKLARHPKAVARALGFQLGGGYDCRQDVYLDAALAIAFLCARDNGAGVAVSTAWLSILKDGI